MTGLPEWVLGLPGFDSNGWWRPIICTNRERHPMELLGVVYEHAEGGGVHWSGGTVLSMEDVGIAFTRIWELPESTPKEQKAIRELRGRGTMYVRCPRGCTPRPPRDQWDEIVSNTRRFDPPWLDVSLYG